MIKITYLILQTITNYGSSTVVVPEPFTLASDCEVQAKRIHDAGDWRFNALCITVTQEAPK